MWSFILSSFGGDRPRMSDDPLCLLLVIFIHILRSYSYLTFFFIPSFSYASQSPHPSPTSKSLPPIPSRKLFYCQFPSTLPLLPPTKQNFLSTTWLTSVGPLSYSLLFILLQSNHQMTLLKPKIR